MAMLLFLVLSAPATAAVTLDDLFDSSARDIPAQGRLTFKQQAFERLLAARGAASVVRAMRRIESGLADLDKRRDKVYARFLKAHKKYFDWRRKKTDDAEAVPAGINKAFLAAEREIRGVNSIVYNDLAFHEWALTRLAKFQRTPDGDYLVALVKDVRHKNPHQRLRCLRLLGIPTDAAALKALRSASEAERHPAVAAALAATGQTDTGKALLSDQWTVRAGAIEGFRRQRTRASAATLVRRLAVEKGRLQDDLRDALVWIAGDEQPDWAAWLKALPEDWAPSPPRPAAPPSPDDAHPMGTASGRTCFGLPTGSERVVLCVDGGAALAAVAKEVERYLGILPPRAEFGIVVYGVGARVFKKKLVAATGANRAAAAKWMAGLKLAGRTDIHDGLELAFDLVGGDGKRPARADTLVLVALQRPSQVGLSPTRVGNPRQIALEWARRNALLRVRLLAFGKSSGGESYYLQNLARPYGGGFRPSAR